VEVASYSLPKIGWKATAGSLDKNELISEFQSALSDEIDNVKRNQGKELELFEGQKTKALGGRYVYNFQSGDLRSWRRRRQGTQLKMTIDENTYYGLVDSWNQNEANIAFEKDLGDFIEKASVEDSSFELLLNLHDKLEKVKTGQADFNSDGCMKLFGFLKPTHFTIPLSFEITEASLSNLNVEQQLAVRKSMSQEVTFIWDRLVPAKPRRLVQSSIF